MIVVAGIFGKEAHEMAKAKKTTAPAPKAAAAPKAKTKKAPAAKAAKQKPAGLEKKYLKTRPACKVTFVLPKEAAPEAETVCILGEFNNWAQDAHPLKKLEDGGFAITLEQTIDAVRRGQERLTASNPFAEAEDSGSHAADVWPPRD